MKLTNQHTATLFITSVGRGYAILSVCLSRILSFCLSVCEQDYCKSNQPISLKLAAMVGPTDRQNWLTFGGVPVPDTDSGSLFHFPHHCGIGYFRRFISISHTVIGRFSRHSANDWRRQGNAYTIFWKRSDRHLNSNPGSLSQVCALWTLPSLQI